MSLSPLKVQHSLHILVLFFSFKILPSKSSKQTLTESRMTLIILIKYTCNFDEIKCIHGEIFHNFDQIYILYIDTSLSLFNYCVKTKVFLIIFGKLCLLRSSLLINCIWLLLLDHFNAYSYTFWNTCFS